MRGIDLTGQRFGRLIVLERAGQYKSGNWMWKCLCDCGKDVVVLGGNLRHPTKPTHSCGCLQRERIKAGHTKWVDNGGLADVSGENHWRYKGGSIIDKQGYVWLRSPVCEYEHKVVMSKHLGRPLYKNESVHHKDGVRHHNKIENLELRASSHGRGQTIPDLIEFAREMLLRYEPSMLR